MGAPPYLFLERPLWTVVFVGSFLAFSFVTSWVHKRERGGDQGKDRDGGSRRTIYLLSFLGIGLAFGGPFLIPSARIALPHEAVFIVAMAFLWAGILLYRWSVLTLGAFFRTQVTLLDGSLTGSSGSGTTIRFAAVLKILTRGGERRKIGQLVRASVPGWTRIERYDPEGLRSPGGERRPEDRRGAF